MAEPVVFEGPEGRCALEGCIEQAGKLILIGVVPGLGEVAAHVCDAHAEMLLRDVLTGLSIELRR